MSGRLFLVSTPIGNLGDLSPRAVDTLRRCALICCEDTRHTRHLLTHAGISGPHLVAADEHSEAARIPEVLAELEAGRDVAVVTDAGTPGISDPGGRLVRAVLDAGHQVSAVPGPAALVMALVTSGFDTSRFVFEGFLPRSGRARTERLDDIATERRTVVLHESPHRVERTVADLAASCGAQRRIALARELTKMYEEIWRGTLGDAIDHLAARAPRGEFVIVVEGAAPPPPLDDDAILVALDHELRSGADRRRAVAAVVASTGAARRRVYDLALTIPRHV